MVSLLAGGAANAAYSSDNDDVYDKYESRCNNGAFTRIREFEDICNELPTVSDSQAASAVSYRAFCQHYNLYNRYAQLIARSTLCVYSCVHIFL